MSENSQRFTSKEMQQLQLTLISYINDAMSEMKNLNKDDVHSYCLSVMNLTSDFKKKVNCGHELTRAESVLKSLKKNEEKKSSVQDEVIDMINDTDEMNLVLAADEIEKLFYVNKEDSSVNGPSTERTSVTMVDITDNEMLNAAREVEASSHSYKHTFDEGFDTKDQIDNLIDMDDENLILAADEIEKRFHAYTKYTLIKDSSSDRTSIITKDDFDKQLSNAVHESEKCLQSRKHKIINKGTDTDDKIDGLMTAVNATRVIITTDEIEGCSSSYKDDILKKGPGTDNNTRIKMNDIVDKQLLNVVHEIEASSNSHKRLIFDKESATEDQIDNLIIAIDENNLILAADEIEKGFCANKEDISIENPATNSNIIKIIDNSDKQVFNTFYKGAERSHSSEHKILNESVGTDNKTDCLMTTITANRVMLTVDEVKSCSRSSNDNILNEGNSRSLPAFTELKPVLKNVQSQLVIGNDQKCSQLLKQAGAQQMVKPIAYVNRTEINKIRTMMKWLNINDNIINSCINNEHKVQVKDIDYNIERLQDSFMEEEIDINLLQPYFTNGTWRKFVKSVEAKKKKNVWICNLCNKICEDEAIFCNSCCCWFHKVCSSVNRKPKAKFWFCSNCQNKDV